MDFLTTSDPSSTSVSASSLSSSSSSSLCASSSPEINALLELDAVAQTDRKLKTKTARMMREFDNASASWLNKQYHSVKRLIEVELKNCKQAYQVMRCLASRVKDMPASLTRSSVGRKASRYVNSHLCQFGSDYEAFESTLARMTRAIALVPEDYKTAPADTTATTETSTTTSAVRDLIKDFSAVRDLLPAKNNKRTITTAFKLLNDMLKC